MKKNWYWSVGVGSGGGQYNDPQYYDICDDASNKVVSDIDRDMLQKICDQHNLCCIELITNRGESTNA